MNMDFPSSCLNPSSHIFQQQLHLQSQPQISDPHAHDDDFLDQMLLSTLPSSSWSEMISPAAACTSPQTHRCCFNFDVAPPEPAAVYPSEIVHNQIAGGMSPPAAMKPALLLPRPSPFPLTDSLLFTDHQSQNFDHPQDVQSLGGAHATAAAMDKFAAVVGTGNSGGGGGAPCQTRQRVRARRGQATDPHSIAERLRRERIAERMKGLQELVPNANKTDKASMLDEIIDYVKFLQLQVKVLSMSRMGGAAAVAPTVADISTEARGGGQIVTSKGVQGTAGTDDGDILTVAEQHVVKMMEEDMGSAMQYLLGKGLCLMPISLATAISSSRNYPLRHPSAATDGPSSPSVSALTVQSAADPSTSVSMC